MKKNKKAKKFRKKNEIAESILTELADALDKARANKLNIKLRHGIVVSRYGYVLPTKRKWVVRMLMDPGCIISDDDDDD